MNPLKRSSGQALFKYLPECVIEAGVSPAVTKVARWIGQPLKPQGVERILEEIHDVARPTALGGAYLDVDRRFPATYAVKSFDFYTPRHIELELFPLTFYNRRQNRYREFTNVEEIKNFFSRQVNPAERDEWVQADLVYVNPKTSAVKSFHVVPCKEHMHNRYMVLDKKGKTSQRDWRWKCIECNREYNVSGYVDGEFIAHASPVRSPVVFQPQIISMVNVRDFSNVKVGKNDANLIIIAKYLDKIEGALDDIFEDVAKEKRSGLTKRTLEYNVAELKEKGEFTEEQIKTITEAWGKAVSKASSELDDALSKTQKLITGFDPQRISYRIYEYLETLSEKTKRTLDDMSNDPKISAQMKMFKEKLNGIGVTKSYVLEKVPIIQVAYGYTRGDLDASKCMLKAFPNPDSEKVLLYANDIETEALLLEVDRQKIGEWLSANGIIKEWTPKTEEDAKAWFLNNIDQSLITRFEGVKESISGSSSATKAVFTLLHTMSHALMKQVPLHSGISTNSLGEIIFPNIPAILIFSNSNGGVNIGELHELYENRTYPWIDNVKDASRNGGCVYDPICFEQDSACHYCMFLHEVTCSHFNKALARDYLFSGGKHVIKFGFWDFDKKVKA